MNNFLKFDISIFSILLLLVVFLTIKIRRDAIGTSSRLFVRLIWITICMLLLEILSWVFDRREGYYYLNYFFNMLFAWSTPLITCVWASYLDYQIYSSYERLQKRWFYIYPFLINTVFIIINFFVPFIFSVSEANVYQRESFMILIPLVNVLTYLYICYLGLKNRHKVQKEVIIVLLMYVFMPVLAAFIQIHLFGIFIMWPMMAVTVMLTYIFLETISNSKDYLTGLVTRHRIDDYIEYMLHQKKRFIVVMIDLDKFKLINDTYGHLNGDKALKVFSKVLAERFAYARIVGRYAGDEFILIIESTDTVRMITDFEFIKNDLYNKYKETELPFLVTFSYGYSINEPSENYTYESLMNVADQKMYEQKHKG